RRQGRQAEALKIFGTNRGRDLMDQIRSNLRSMMDSTAELFNQQRASARQTSENMFRIIGLATVLAFLFVLSLTIFFTQDLTGSVRRLIRAADRISSGKYEFVSTA